MMMRVSQEIGSNSAQVAKKAKDCFRWFLKENINKRKNIFPDCERKDPDNSKLNSNKAHSFWTRSKQNNMHN